MDHKLLGPEGNSMQNLVSEIKAIPGVIGACCHHSQQGLVANSLPGLFKTDKLAAMGKHMARLLAAGRLNFPDLNDMVLQYEETTIVGKSIEQNLVLAVLCDPGINMNLLTMSLNLAMDNLSLDPQPAAAAPPPAGGAAATEVPVADSKAIEVMKNALSKVVGPMASIMFEDALQEAHQSGESGNKLLTRLQAILTREIGDEEMAANYRQLVSDSLRETD
ncbi:MAG: hypothetical protein D6751_08910 [Deltaproteobacteria bacterium]|nr:MAG: hypothetical protein D6751_08910 [Deltaproteobacteria bacterium]